MSMIYSARRFARPLFFLGFLCSCLLTAAPARAGNIDPILLNYWTHPKLEYGNANKIATGRFNRLHGVFTQDDPQNGYSEIIYVHYDPLDPNYPWTEHWLSNDAKSSQPALAVDTGQLANNGMAAVVWVSKGCDNNPNGSLYYSYQTQLNCVSCWTQPRKIVHQGTEPSITAVNGTIHLTWTTGDRVQYTSFPRTSPPTTPLAMGQVVDFTNCPNTRLSQPSIAYAHPPCGTPTLKIAALLTSNEQGSVGSCQSANTLAGPRVYERDNTTQVWSTVFNDVVSDPTPNQPNPVPVSLSLSSNRVTGDFFLAWSDEQDSAARTRMGHGNGANWDIPQTIDNLRHHVHVAAKGGAGGHFRLAVGDQGWSTSAFSQTGKWSSGGLSWTSPSASIPSSSYPLAGHPQAFYWRRCASNQLTEMKVYTEASDWNTNFPPSEVATDRTQTGPVSCSLINIGDVIVLPDCFQTQVRVSLGKVLLAGGAGGVLVEVGETGAVTKLSATGAEITTVSGAKIQLTWAPGDIISSWDNGFIVATSRDTVRVSGQDSQYVLEDLGLVASYTRK